MKAGLGPHSDPFFELLFQFLKSASFLVIQQVGNQRMHRDGCLGPADVKHLAAQFTKYLVTDGGLGFDVSAPFTVGARFAHHAADAFPHPLPGHLHQSQFRDFQYVGF